MEARPVSRMLLVLLKTSSSQQQMYSLMLDLCDSWASPVSRMYHYAHDKHVIAHF
jgi:hypothetical protein